MRVAFILSFLANVAVTLAAMVILPDRVAIHFGLGGTPDGWASTLTSTLIMLSIQCLVFCSLYFSPRLLDRVPDRWISLPNRDFWLRPEHRPQAMEIMARHIWRFGTALFLFLLFTSILTIEANLSGPVRLDEAPLLMALVIFMAYTVYWMVALLKAFRVPSEQ